MSSGLKAGCSTMSASRSMAASAAVGGDGEGGRRAIHGGADAHGGDAEALLILRKAGEIAGFGGFAHDERS